MSFFFLTFCQTRSLTQSTSVCFLKTKFSSKSTDSSAIKDNVWNLLRFQAKEIIRREPTIYPLIEEGILKHKSFKEALIYRLATKLGGNLLVPSFWIDVMSQAMDISLESDIFGDIEKLAIEDLIAVEEKDPACTSIAQAFLYFKGYKALQAYRFSNILWKTSRTDLAMVMQARTSEVFAVDIHPNAQIGGGMMIDHATGVVIGETAVVGENCSFLHGVTLGATGSVAGDRHPKIGSNCFVGCQATILGNINIGSNCRIGAGSIVLKDLETGTTAVGNPLRILNVDSSNSNNNSNKKQFEIDNDEIASITEDMTAFTGSIITWNKIWTPKRVQNYRN